ncbi:hypothetical protein LWI28_002951 [Acer negundo]|uniref:Uncharacterized protein n=1 Tax=Acer negundo TaxID=4023 RepID=A0AAD5NKC5_ACENE|nr:hypothetical protein LWI28_002951 [Acer negundo]
MHLKYELYSTIIHRNQTKTHQNAYSIHIITKTHQNPHPIHNITKTKPYQNLHTNSLKSTKSDEMEQHRWHGSSGDDEIIGRAVCFRDEPSSISSESSASSVD